jgi:hypothetical protein
MRLKTWSGRSEFTYEGSIDTGVVINYGSEGACQRLSKAQLSALLKHFRGSTVNIGTSRDTAPTNSLGKWLQENVTPTAIASYIGPMLIDQGWAKKGPGRARITIFKRQQRKDGDLNGRQSTSKG